MRAVLKRIREAWWKLRGIDPEPIIATLSVGGGESTQTAATQAMERRMRELLPNYRHITVPVESLATSLRHKRIGMIAAPPAAWRAALSTAPLRTMAFNSRGENWAITLASPISSFLFLRGLPLDRITLRPWFWPGSHKRTITPEAIGTIECRAASPLRAPFAVLSPYMPWPLSHGGAVRIFSLLREAARDFDVHLYVFTETPTAPDPGPLKDICHRITYVEKPHYYEPRWSTLLPPEVCEYRSLAMQRALRSAGPLQIEYTMLAGYCAQTRPNILVEHDVTHDLYTQIHNSKRTLSSWWDLYRWKRFEQQAVRRSRPIVMSEKDRTMLGVANALVIGNGVDLDRFQPTPERTGNRILFVGSFRHFPNINALRWFLTEVWPLVRARTPVAHLTVVAGSDSELHWRNITGERELPSGPGLTLHGFVADVKPLYQETNAVIVPTLVSAGTNLKVLEAMAMQRALVSTPSGVAGIGLTHGQDVLIGESPADFASHVTRLLSDANLRSQLAASASTIAHAHFSWKSLALVQRDLWHQYSPPRLTIEQEPSPTSEFASYPSLVARCNGQLVAHLTWRDIPAEAGLPSQHEILWLEIALQYRRQGLAGRLIEQALSANPGQWFLEVRESNVAARDLYRKLHFSDTGRRRHYYTNPEEDAILMATQP